MLWVSIEHSAKSFYKQRNNIILYIYVVVSHVDSTRGMLCSGCRVVSNECIPSRASRKFYLTRLGFEPATFAFLGRCSTVWATRSSWEWLVKLWCYDVSRCKNFSIFLYCTLYKQKEVCQWKLLVMLLLRKIKNDHSFRSIKKIQLCLPTESIQNKDSTNLLLTHVEI